MAAWFSRVFQTEAPGATDIPAPPEADPSEAAPAPIAEDKPRRVVEAPIIHEDAGAAPLAPGEIRIKARLNEFDNSCTFFVSQPVLEDYSLWCPDRNTANATSPLAAAIFDLGCVATVLLHGSTVTVTGDGSGGRTWEEGAKEIGSQIRAHLKSGMPCVHPEVLDSMPSEEAIREGLQRVLDEEINPGIAAHSGVITLERVEGNTAFISMGGGCQGCAASTITLRQGVHRAFREAVPEVGAIYDVTDHSAGTNPFFSELPAEMGG